MDFGSESDEGPASEQNLYTTRNGDLARQGQRVHRLKERTGRAVEGRSPLPAPRGGAPRAHSASANLFVLCLNYSHSAPSHHIIGLRFAPSKRPEKLNSLQTMYAPPGGKKGGPARQGP